MKKRLLAMLLCLCMAAALLPGAAAASTVSAGLTRSDAAKIIYSLMNPSVSLESVTLPDDCTGLDTKTQDAIKAMCATGWMSTVSEGTFDPTRPLSRAEAAAIVCRVRDISTDQDVDISQIFTDVPAGHWARSAVAGLYAGGVIPAPADKQFRPGSSVSETDLRAWLTAEATQQPGQTGQPELSDAAYDYYTGTLCWTGVNIPKTDRSNYFWVQTFKADGTLVNSSGRECMEITSDPMQIEVRKDGTSYSCIYKPVTLEAGNYKVVIEYRGNAYPQPTASCSFTVSTPSQPDIPEMKFAGPADDVPTDFGLITLKITNADKLPADTTLLLSNVKLIKNEGGTVDISGPNTALRTVSSTVPTFEVVLSDISGALTLEPGKYYSLSFTAELFDRNNQGQVEPCTHLAGGNFSVMFKSALTAAPGISDVTYDYDTGLLSWTGTNIPKLDPEKNEYFWVQTVDAGGSFVTGRECSEDAMYGRTPVTRNGDRYSCTYKPKTLEDGNYRVVIELRCGISPTPIGDCSFTVPTSTTKPAQSAPANPTNDKLTVNGEAVIPAAYKINGSNYFKLRDVAMMLNGSLKQFSVDYDNAARAITISTGKAYAPTGSELKDPPTASGTATITNDVIYINGEKSNLTVYKINGANYLKIRELAIALDFNVGWSLERGMFIEGDKGYDPAN